MFGERVDIRYFRSIGKYLNVQISELGQFLEPFLLQGYCQNSIKFWQWGMFRLWIPILERWVEEEGAIPKDARQPLEKLRCGR
jgi:hypothetical protein